MGNEKSYRNLQVYQESHVLVKLVYRDTAQFPKQELFGLTSQMRRAAVSVPANILEGYGRGTKREFRHFLSIARGSLGELEYYIELSLDLGYLNQDQYKELEKNRFTIGLLLGGLLRSLKTA